MLHRLGGAMPFPPPPAPTPRVPAVRPPPRRPRKTAVPTSAPPGPSPSAAAAGEKQRPPARSEALLSRSWPSATLRKPPARCAPGPASRRALAAAGSGASPTGTTETTALGPGRDAAARSPLSLPPEATLVLQRCHLEQQLLARPRRLLPAPSANATLPLGPRAKAAGPRRGGNPGGLDARPPGVALLPRGRRAHDLGPRPADLRRVLKVSLLNDQHKYDDVEYEEEAVVVDEGLVRRCTEWLRGVEAATSARSRTQPLDVLPHLSSTL